MPTHEFHDLAALFPMMTEAELDNLAGSIQRRGLLYPIVLYEGKVLDGRNRLLACEKAGVEPMFTEYRGDHPLEDVIAWNADRRDLSTSQRAAIAVTAKAIRIGYRESTETRVTATVR